MFRSTLFTVAASLMVVFTACSQNSTQTGDSTEVDPQMLKYRFNENVNYYNEPTTFPPYSAESLLKLAAKHVGTPYLANGKQPGGFDCSGFVFYLHKQFGIYLPYFSSEMAHLGKEIDTKQARPGDLIYFKGENKNDDHAGHVGIVVSKSGQPLKFIHSSTSKGVRYDVVEANPYFEPRFMFVKRVVE